MFFESFLAKYSKLSIVSVVRNVVTICCLVYGGSLFENTSQYKMLIYLKVDVLASFGTALEYLFDLHDLLLSIFYLQTHPGVDLSR